jgi:hypothetical protein
MSSDCINCSKLTEDSLKYKAGGRDNQTSQNAFAADKQEKSISMRRNLKLSSPAEVI